LQIQDRSPQSRPVASRNQSQTHSDATGLHCGDRSWICNAPYDAGLKRAARGSLKIQDAKIRHLRTIAQICRAISSQLGRVSTIGQKFVKQ